MNIIKRLECFTFEIIHNLKSNFVKPLTVLLCKVQKTRREYNIDALN